MGIGSDFMSMWQAIANGMVANNIEDCQKYWDYWCDYSNIYKIDTFFSNISCPIKHDVIITAFADWFRSGVYGKTLQIKLKESQTISYPSPRPSNWMENLVPSIGKKENTS